MKFVNTKSTILIGTILVIIALSMSLTSSSEVVSMATSSSEASVKSKLQGKSKSTAKAQLKSQSRVRKEKVYSFQTPPGAPAPPSAKANAAPAPAPASKKENTKENAKENAVKPTAGQEIILNDWLMVASATFKSSAVFPEIFTGYMNTNVRIRTDSYDFRLNDAHKKDANENNNPEQEKHFWFRLTKEMIFYSSTKEDLNILGGNKISHITHAATLKRHDLGYYCFSINDRSGHDWKICSELEKTRNTWYCEVQKLRGQKLEKFCLGTEGDDANIVYKNVNIAINIFYCLNNIIFKLIQRLF